MDDGAEQQRRPGRRGRVDSRTAASIVRRTNRA